MFTIIKIMRNCLKEMCSGLINLVRMDFSQLATQTLSWGSTTRSLRWPQTARDYRWSKLWCLFFM